MIQPWCTLETESLEVGASSSLLLNAFCWATWNKPQPASGSLKNQLLKKQGKWPGVTEEASTLKRVDPQISAEPSPASKKTTHIPPREQAPQNKQTRQQADVLCRSCPWTCQSHESFAIKSSVSHLQCLFNYNSVHYIQKRTRITAGCFQSLFLCSDEKV